MKEKIKSLIWKCFECHLDGNDNFVTYSPIEGLPGLFKMRFFNLEDYENYNGDTDTFGWGILLQDYTSIHCMMDGEPDETMFYIYDYFDGTPADLFRNTDKVIDGMAEDIWQEVKKSMHKRNEFIVNA